MEPLRIDTRITGPICLPDRPIALDALLAAAVAVRAGIAPATTREEVVDIEIPVQRATCGRYHLASVAEYAVEVRSLQYLTKRAPVEQYQTIGSHSIRRVDITAGPNKSYRIPMETLHLVDDRLTWWCVGDANETRALLQLIAYLGRKRSVGLGCVVGWNVERCDTWPGFPVLRSGHPLRTLPHDAPGLHRDVAVEYAVLTYPYWRHEAEELCVVPQRQV